MKSEFTLGVSLSGGGAKGFAHLGVLEALNERGLYPEVISGTSAGAFAGVLYADGHKPREILEFFKTAKFTEFAKFVMPKGGLFKSTPFHTFLQEHLNAKKFEELKVPLIVTATNIEEGKIKYFKSGDLISPVIASCSVPVIFTPVEIKGKHYVDGGLLKKFPVSTIKKSCHKVIGVNVSPLISMEYKSSLSYVMERTFHHMSNANMFQDRKLCDYLIESDTLLKYSMFDLKHVEEIFEIGKVAAADYLEANKGQLKQDFPDFKD